jgi:hypothetical protein
MATPSTAFPSGCPGAHPSLQVHDHTATSLVRSARVILPQKNRLACLFLFLKRSHNKHYPLSISIVLCVLFCRSNDGLRCHLITHQVSFTSQFAIKSSRAYCFMSPWSQGLAVCMVTSAHKSRQTSSRREGHEELENAHEVYGWK